MMKLNLGKILIILCLPYIIYAKATLEVPKSFFKGEVVNFSIVCRGGSIKIPPITSIEGIAVQSTGTSKQTTIINGVRKHIFTKSYSFMPVKDTTIPSFDITIDNQIQKTKIEKIVMMKVEKTNSKYYDLDIKVDKNNGYVGEGILFDLTFKYRKELSVVGLDFSKPDFNNFWVKELKNNQEQPFNDDYRYQKLTYLLFPQKSGKLEIGPLKIGIVTRDNKYENNFFLSSSTKSTPVYSNTINLDIKKLPKDVNLIGDFNIVSTVDKNSLESGEAVAYKVIVKGRGNIDDVDEIKLDIPNATIYENPSNKQYNMQNNKYGGVYTKTFSIVAGENFTIPSFTIKYFDKKTKSVKTIQTKSYDIKVKAQQKVESKLEVTTTNSDEVVQKEKVVTKIVETTDQQKIIYFFIGLFVGVLIVLLYILFRNRTIKKDDDPIIKTIKKIKTQDELFKVLIVYINIDDNLDKIIYKLENKLENSEFKMIKKELLNIFQELEKKDIKLNI
ncbi:MAG: BatD family protein [Campylobacterota bacterium]|nr:BatD family protein [Campylobacterota bacterium]